MSKKEVIKDEGEFLNNIGVPLRLEDVVVTENNVLQIRVVKCGKRYNIDIEFEGFGRGKANEKPYTDLPIAQREYNKLLNRVSDGKYLLELHPKGRINLVPKS